MIHKTKCAALLTILAALVLAVAPVYADWDAARDFSTTSNPNGAWTFGYLAHPDIEAPGFVVYTQHGNLSTYPVSYGSGFYTDANIDAWTRIWGDGTEPNDVVMPCVTHNGTTDVQRHGGGYYWWNPGELALMSDGRPYALRSSTVRWTAPSDGVYTIDATFAVRGEECDQLVRVMKNLSDTLDEGTIAYNAGLTRTYINPGLSLAAGDTLEFMLPYDSAKWPGNNVGLDVRIAAVYGELRGHVTLQDFGGDESAVAVKVELLQGGNIVRTEKIILSSTGEFTVGGLNAGPYDVAVKAACWLRSKQSVTVIAGDTVNLGTITLKSGDMDGDNEVTPTDLSGVLRNMDLMGDW